MILSAEQERGLALLRSVCSDGGVGMLVGEAGSGKSTGLNVFRKERPNLVVTAPTGIAAMNVGGITIDKLMGYELGVTTVKQVSRTNKEKIIRSGGIVIDEKSMLRADKLDRIDRDLRTTFGNTIPFGGIGIFLIGDPYQLEPVVPFSGPEAEHWKKLGYKSPWFFDSKVWQQIEPETVKLTKIFRQDGEDEFKTALNLIRVGDHSGLPFVNTRARQIPRNGSIVLCFRNNVADDKNAYAMAMIAGEEKTYLGKKKGDVAGEMPSPIALTLKLGCRVIATTNHRPETVEDPILYVNGDLGTVVKLNTDSVVVLFDRGHEVELFPHKWKVGRSDTDDQGELFRVEAEGEEASYEQIPLKVAYAISVHKSQGMTLSSVHLAIPGGAFAHGMAYVALSRCKSLEGMTLSRKLEPSDLIVHYRVREFMKELEKEAAIA